MGKNVDKLTLGNGTLYVNGVDVGYLDGAVELSYERNMLDFKPSNALGAVKKFVIGESASLSATIAELKTANLKLAMGIAEDIGVSQNFPSYEGDPESGSYTPDASASYDVLNFGGKKTIDEMPIRFVHERPDGKDVVVVLYNCTVNPTITIPFNDDALSMHEITFEAQHETSRDAGDQLGFVAEQVA